MCLAGERLWDVAGVVKYGDGKTSKNGTGAACWSVWKASCPSDRRLDGTGSRFAIYSEAGADAEVERCDNGHALLLSLRISPNNWMHRSVVFDEEAFLGL